MENKSHVWNHQPATEWRRGWQMCTIERCLVGLGSLLGSGQPLQIHPPRRRSQRTPKSLGCSPWRFCLVWRQWHVNHSEARCKQDELLKRWSTLGEAASCASKQRPLVGLLPVSWPKTWALATSPQPDCPAPNHSFPKHAFQEILCVACAAAPHISRYFARYCHPEFCWKSLGSSPCAASPGSAPSLSGAAPGSPHWTHDAGLERSKRSVSSEPPQRCAQRCRRCRRLHSRAPRPVAPRSGSTRPSRARNGAPTRQGRCPKGSEPAAERSKAREIRPGALTTSEASESLASFPPIRHWCLCNPKALDVRHTFKN